jgi:hypothetical protein
MDLSGDTISEEFNSIIPVSSVVNSDSLFVYEFYSDGTISKLETYNGIPTDDNHLNNILQHTNLLFDKLLEIEEKYGI